MSEAINRYKVSYAGRVTDALLVLADSARDGGFGGEFSIALRAMDFRLQVYPQFGEPYRDVPSVGGVEWIGSVGPIVV